MRLNISSSSGAFPGAPRRILPLLAAAIMLISVTAAHAVDPILNPSEDTTPEQVESASLTTTTTSTTSTTTTTSSTTTTTVFSPPFLDADADAPTRSPGEPSLPAGRGDSPTENAIPVADGTANLLPQPDTLPAASEFSEPATPPPPPGPLVSAGIIVEGLEYDISMPWGDPDFESFRTAYMTRSGQKWLAAVMTGALPYLAYVEERIEYYKLPQELVYLPVVESEYSPTAVSRSGAVGLWQFMKNSIAGYGMKIDDWVDERRDFMKSTDGALKKLADNYKALGDWPLAIAAYNAGLGAVTRALAKTGVEKPGVDDLRKQDLIAKETLGYVPKFLAVASILRYPTLHGMPENWGEPSTWQALPANQSVDLSLLAELSGIPDETLRRGNPELRKEVTPPNPDHLIKVPIAMAEAAKAILDDTSRPLIRFYSYKVKSGDNVGAIARGYKTTITTIVGANPGLDPDRIQIGQILKIPAYGGAKPPAETASAPAPKHATNAANLPATETPTNSAQASATEPAAGKPDPAPPAQIVAPAPAATPSQSPPVFSSSHTVVKGDTIWNISRRYKIKPEVLAEKNGLRLEGIIKIGQVLAVPALN